MSRTVFLNFRARPQNTMDYSYALASYLFDPYDDASADILLSPGIIEQGCKSATCDNDNLEISLIRSAQQRKYDEKSYRICLSFAKVLNLQQMIMFFMYQVPVSPSTFSFYMCAEDQPLEYLIANYLPCSYYFIALYFVFLSSRHPVLPASLFYESLHSVDSCTAMHLLNALFYAEYHYNVAVRQSLKALQLFVDPDTIVSALRLLCSCIEAYQKETVRILLKHPMVVMANLNSVNPTIMKQQIQLCITLVQVLDKATQEKLCYETELFDRILRIVNRAGLFQKRITEGLCDLMFCLRECSGFAEIIQDFSTCVRYRFIDSFTVRYFLLQIEESQDYF